MANALSTQLSPSGFITGQIRRTDRNFLAWNLAALAVVLALCWISSTYYYYFFHGPLPADDNTLLSLARASDHRILVNYLEVKDHPLTPAGWTEVSTNNDVPYSRIPLFLMRVGDQWMLVMSKRADAGRDLMGSVYRVPKDVQSEVIPALERRNPQLHGRILPVLFNGEVAFKVSGYVGLALLVPAGLLVLFNVVRALSRTVSLDAARHPLVRRLKPFGDPMTIAAEIDREASDQSVRTVGTAVVTRSWVLRPMRFRLIVVRIEDIVWAYHQNTGGRHTAMLFTRDGKIRPVWLKKGTVDELLRLVAERAPWAFAGFDVQRLKTWSRGRQEVIAAADERRRSRPSMTRLS
ncbi:MAG: hypothetical protein JWO87_3797 [Phycisphaerales bacterium]|nr:hypothetical protein [Phycisphaerales bacterium]